MAGFTAALVFGWALMAAAAPLDLDDHTQCALPAGFPALPATSWRHLRSKMVTKVADPNHFARDAVTTPGSAVRLGAKLTYGDGSKDLEDEKARVLLQSCDGWTVLGTVTTDDEGWARVRLESAPAPGIYRLFFQVLADGTYATSKLWVVPRGTPVAVFDIDGTLTTADEEAVRELTDDVFNNGDYVPRAYPGGKQLSRWYARRGFLVVYLTGRPYWLLEPTQRWLREQGMAAGVLRLTTSHAQVWPTLDSVARFKLGELKALAADGLVVRAAHGNATTDIAAYLGAGLPGEHVYIIGAHAGEQGTRAVSPDWRALLDQLGGSPTAEQKTPGDH